MGIWKSIQLISNNESQAQVLQGQALQGQALQGQESQPGYVESWMNQIIFMPPNPRDHPNNSRPPWLKFLKTPCNKNIAYFVIQPEKTIGNKKYILWSHSNASDLNSIYRILVQFYNQLNREIGIIAYDYQGYGFSDGTCSEKNCYDDIKHMVNYILCEMNVEKGNLFLFGQSLGTGIVVDFCSRNEWKTPIVLLSPYKSIARVKVNPHRINVVANCLVDRLDMFTSHYKIHALKCPIIIYHGLKDTLVYPDHSQEMYEQHKNKIILILLENAGHNNILHHIDPCQILNMVYDYSI
jgi:abhydrolase domain-containing protein 17